MACEHLAVSTTDDIEQFAHAVALASPPSQCRSNGSPALIRDDVTEWANTPEAQGGYFSGELSIRLYRTGFSHRMNAILYGFNDTETAERFKERFQGAFFKRDGKQVKMLKYIVDAPIEEIEEWLEVHSQSGFHIMSRERLVVVETEKSALMLKMRFDTKDA